MKVRIVNGYLLMKDNIVNLNHVSAVNLNTDIVRISIAGVSKVLVLRFHDDNEAKRLSEFMETYFICKEDLIGVLSDDGGDDDRKSFPFDFPGVEPLNEAINMMKEDGYIKEAVKILDPYKDIFTVGMKLRELYSDEERAREVWSKYEEFRRVYTSAEETTT